MKKKLIIAHRGASAYEKENTIEAFEKALAMDADMIEFDVRRTKDKVYVAHHDLLKKRLRKNLCIPTVEEILKKFKKKTKFDIHLKERAHEKDIVRLIKKYLANKRFIVTSEFIESLKKIKKQYPGIRLGHVLMKGSLWQFLRRLSLSRKCPQSLMREAVKAGLEFIVPDYRFAGKRFLQEAEKQGIKVIPWSVNSPRAIKRFLEFDQVYGIITDKPDWPIKKLKN